MRKHPDPSQTSGFLIPRLAVATALFAAAATMSWLAFAVPTPPSGTLTENNTLTFQTGPNVRSNPTSNTAIAGAGLICNEATPCEDYALTVTVPAGYENSHNMVITTSWTTPGEDYDVYLYQGTSTTPIKDAASSSNPEVMIASAASGSYVVRVVPFAVAGGTTTTRIELRQKPVTVTPVPPGPGSPRYQVFQSPPGIGDSAGEPTLGAGKPSLTQPGGPTMYIASLQTLRVTWDDCASPATALWEDKSFPTTSLVTLDPILFTDVGAGRLSPARTFVSQLGPKTSSLVFSDDNGESYLQSQGSGINSGVDHQTIGGGPYRENANPPPPPHPLYPNAIYYASQDLAVAQLARSDTGGATFGPAVPMYNLTQCGGLHGHIKVAPDGTVYVPNRGCGGGQGVIVSEDNGLTFAVRVVPGSSPGDTDPSLGIDADGKIYFAFSDGDGHPKVAVSSDKGVTWSPPIDVGVPFGLQNSVFATAVGGSAGRATVMYISTETPGNYTAINSFAGIWHVYAASTFDGGANWTTVRVTPENDPVQRGSICTNGTACGPDRNLLDFNDMEIDHEGRVLMAFADGCVGCTSPTGADSRSAKATIARQSGGKRMIAQFDPPAEPAVAAAPRVTSVIRTGDAVRVNWLAPDNGGSAITGYNVYRKEGAKGMFVRLGGSNPPTAPANRTSYDDLTASPTAEYFYKVTAVNAIGESTFCGEFPVSAAPVVPDRCVLPGIGLLVDPAGDETGDPANAQRDIRELSVAELYNPASSVNRVTFRLKVSNLSPIPAPSSRWTIFFTRQDPAPATTSTEWFVSMVTDDTASPGTPVYRYGHTSIGTGGVRQLTTDGTADSGSNSPDGTILINIGAPTQTNTGTTGRAFPPIMPGESFTLVNAITQQSGAALLITTDSTGNAQYTVAGNNSCAPNAAPVAALAATPLTGTAPLTVNFDASGSSDPDAGDGIASYTFNYGDGTTEVKNVPTASHTYTDSGVFNASVRVTDSRGRVSSNPANAVIQVASTLSGIVSRKTHGAAGTFDVNLPNSGPVGVEPRNSGNTHTMVFTFQRNLTAVTSSSVTEGTATKTSEGVGPNPNQYSVTLTGVVNAQFVSVTLDGVQDSAGANLTGVKGRMAVLNGDTTGNLVVNSSDIGQAKSISGQPASETNFRTDVNVNGDVNSSDISQIKANSGTSLQQQQPTAR
jgi:hypothetical protein